MVGYTEKKEESGKDNKRKQKNVVTAKEEHVIFCSCRFLRRQKLVVEFERNKTMSSLT